MIGQGASIFICEIEALCFNCKHTKSKTINESLAHASSSLKKLCYAVLNFSIVKKHGAKFCVVLLNNRVLDLIGCCDVACDWAACDRISNMKKPTKQKLKGALLAVFIASLAALLLLVAKFRSNTSTMALSSLAMALQSNDQSQVKRLSTPGGLASLQALTSRYGQKRLGDYLIAHKAVRPTPHVFITIVVFMLEDSQTPPVTAFFKWTWDGWKLTSINGTPTLQLDNGSTGKSIR